MQYGVQRFENGFLGAHMTHRTQSLHFAGVAWPHGLRALSNCIGYTHMTHIDARTGAWVSHGLRSHWPCLHDPHQPGNTLAFLPSICLPFCVGFWPRGEG